MIRAISDNAGVFTVDSQLKSAISKLAAQRPADDATSVELSASHDVFGAVSSFFNQGDPGHLSAAAKLSPSEKKQFNQIVAELLKSGYTGYEELVVNNKVEHHDIDMQMGDDRLHHARLYKKPVGQK